jgi:hypothetical protein
VNAEQIILAAEVTVDAPDFAHRESMLAALRDLQRHGNSKRPDAVIADAAHWHTAQMQRIAGRGIEVLILPEGTMREGERPVGERPLRTHAPAVVHRSHGVGRTIRLSPGFRRLRQPPDGGSRRVRAWLRG